MNEAPFLALSEACRRLSVHDLQIVLTVCQAGGIRKAADVLGIGQSAVTRRIQKLEDALGVSLFERSPLGTRLTAAGWDFSKRAGGLINDLKVAIACAQIAGEGRNGRLRIGILASLSQGPFRDVVSAFLNHFPEIDLTFAKGDRSELMTLLSHRALDVVFASGAPSAADDDMLLLAVEQVYVAVSRRDPLAKLISVQWSELLDAPFVVGIDEPGPEVSDYVLRRVSDLGRQAKLQRHRLDREGIMNLVGMGVGITPICEHWCGVHYPNVVSVPLKVDDNWETIPFSLTWRPENDNPALRRFLSLAREVAKAGATSSGPS